MATNSAEAPQPAAPKGIEKTGEGLKKEVESLASATPWSIDKTTRDKGTAMVAEADKIVATKKLG